jgi:hypothetical protein
MRKCTKASVWKRITGQRLATVWSYDKRDLHMKVLKAELFLSFLVLGITHQASATFFDVNFDLGSGNIGTGQFQVQTNIDNTFYASSGSLDISGGAAGGTWTLYTAGASTTFPNFLTSPGGGYWYNNAVYVDGVNPQYPGTNPILDNYGLLFVQNNGNELNLWGNADGSYTLGGSVGGFQNFNVILQLGGASGTPGISITQVPEPTTAAFLVLGGLLFTSRTARKSIA